MAWGERSSLVLPLGFGEHGPVFKGLNKWGERSSLVLPLGFHGPLCMHCSAAVWYFSLLAAAALGASASAGLVAPCWKVPFSCMLQQLSKMLALPVPF